MLYAYLCADKIEQNRHRMKLKNMKKISVLGIFLAFFLSGCGSVPEVTMDDGTPLMGGSAVYTLTNLHPDPMNNRLFSINYQQAGFIPRCTPVEITDLKSDVMTFSADGSEYTYIFHGASGDFGENITLYFGSSCDENAADSLSEIDREGIAEGKAKVGMSKAGIQLAIGYPPPHQTPSLDADFWRYWQNRFNTFILEFDSSGKVTQIID